MKATAYRGSKMKTVSRTQTLYYVGWHSFHQRGYLVAYDRVHDVVGILKYYLDSTMSTEEASKGRDWEEEDNWFWRGDSKTTYAVCVANKDFRLPDRQMQKDDVDAKWLFKLQLLFAEWVDAGKPMWEENPREYNAINGNIKSELNMEEAMSTFDKGAAHLEREREHPFGRPGLPVNTDTGLPVWLEDAREDVRKGVNPPEKYPD